MAKIERKNPERLENQRQNRKSTERIYGWKRVKCINIHKNEQAIGVFSVFYDTLAHKYT